MTQSFMNIHDVLEEVAREYPPDVINNQLFDIQRIAFHISLVLQGNGENSSICDLGGGTGFFAIVCAALGMKAAIVDDFNDRGNQTHGQGPKHLHKRYDVRVISQDLIMGLLPFEEASFDVITSFDSMEHWHHSPKRLFQEVMRVLKPSGRFILGVPNCVNLRKRLTVPFGFGKWSSIDDWYEQETFRGHVREPDVEDLRYIANDMGLMELQILGRNWMAYHRLPHGPATLTDYVLRPFPSLCSDIYLLGVAPRVK
jgi:SAM-dependent methyltransferase